jgi:hypothetical protein
MCGLAPLAMAGVKPKTLALASLSPAAILATRMGGKKKPQPVTATPSNLGTIS